MFCRYNGLIHDFLISKLTILVLLSFQYSRIWIYQKFGIFIFFHFLLCINRVAVHCLMVVILGNEYSNLSSNPGQKCLYFTDWISFRDVRRTLNGVSCALSMTLNCIWWWSPHSGDLGHMEYPFIIITSRSLLWSHLWIK